MKIIENRKIFYIISVILLIPCLISLFTRGLNLGIDFRGGSLLTVKIASLPDAASVRAALQESGLNNVEIQISEDQYIMRMEEIDQAKNQEILGNLANRFGEVVFLGAETVGAAIGKELVQKAILAVLLAAVLMLIYISIRFEWRFGLSAFITELHDVLIVIGIFSIFQWEVNTPFIAAVLTVVGYSINDTIVIFDRVRENLRNTRKEDYAILVNRSVGQSFARSVNTLLTVIFPLLALLFLGGLNLQSMVLAMLIGFVIGGYSSICVASPLWYELKTR
ncbi:MAG: protein translocase subunit SecF [Syntrophomonadaceae bacterium]|jgi:preprotein translocase subunit SecF|nr:protein translocase subunit SecF [Syntrophomonadaceae bacterium]